MAPHQCQGLLPHSMLLPRMALNRNTSPSCHACAKYYNVVLNARLAIVSRTGQSHRCHRKESMGMVSTSDATSAP